MDKFTLVLSDEIVSLTAIPNRLNDYLIREAFRQAPLRRPEFEELNLDYDQAFRFMGGENLEYHWSADLMDGSEVLAIYRKGYQVPLIMLNKPFPWRHRPQHRKMSESLEYHWKVNPTNQHKHAGITVVEMLDSIMKTWMMIDYGDIHRRNVYPLFENFNIEAYT